MVDDVLLPHDFDRVLEELVRYLDSGDSNWDIFSSLMADAGPSAKVLSVEEYSGRTYVAMDKMVGMVFNIYSKTAVGILAQWDPVDADPVTSTIDGYLERQKELSVVVAVPFIAGHAEAMTSTLRGFGNTRYAPLIGNSQEKIEQLARDWKLEQKTRASHDSPLP